MEMDFSGLISSDGKPAFEADDAMTEGVDNQIKTLFKAELEKLLKHENIEYKNIEIIYKTNAEGGTAIDEIEVTTESKTVNAEYIQKFLAEKTGIGNIKVIAEES